MRGWFDRSGLLAAVLALAVAVCGTGTAHAQAAAARVALVVGNARYADSPLANPANDAQDLAARLRELGFAVTLRTNLDRQQLTSAIRDFGRAAVGAEAALFYFAGHGLQIQGRNYLLPVGQRFADEGEVETDAVDVAAVLRRMDEAGARVSLLVLDACRNNPLPRSRRSAARGLARMDAPSGALVAFAAQPGAEALDGQGRNGVYTKHLLRHIGTPGIPVEQVFKRVRADVERETGRAQSPREESSLTADFFFQPEAVAAPTLPAVSTPTTTASTTASTAPNPVPSPAPTPALAASPTTTAASPSAMAPATRPAGVADFSTGTLRKLRDSGSIVLGVRESAGLLSFAAGAGRYDGYHVELCRRLAQELGRQLGRELAVHYQPVTSQNRIPLVQNGTVDLECGSTTNNQARQRDVAFALTTFVEETSVLVRADSPIRQLADLQDRAVVTTTGTTSAAVLRVAAPGLNLAGREVFGRDHQDSFQLLASGRADAFVMDRTILAGLAARSGQPERYRLLPLSLRAEPLALMLRRDDAGFKRFVDEHLRALIASGELAQLYDRWFLNQAPGTGLRLALPMGERLRAALAQPDDRPTEAY